MPTKNLPLVLVAAALAAATSCKSDTPAGGEGGSEELSSIPDLKAACAKQDLDACYKLGSATLRGEGIAEDAAAAAALFKRGCDAKHNDSCVGYALVLRGGKGVDKDPLAAARLLKTTCAGGYAPACAALQTCPVQMNPAVTMLGKPDKVVIESSGAPTSVQDFKPSKKGTKRMFSELYAKALGYTTPSRMSGGYVVSSGRFYNLDENKIVVGFTSMNQNHPSRLLSVAEVVPGSADVDWDWLYKTGQQGGGAVVHGVEVCGSNLVTVAGWCLPVEQVDSETYKKARRPPKSLGECRFYAVKVADVDHVEPTGTKVAEYTF